ncbi:MAG: hypothetical protein ACE365_02455 [Gammaproteobacteria bacterium]
MNTIMMAPFKSVAVALVFVILFGPVGLFYSSLLGGIVMTVLAGIAAFVLTDVPSFLPMAGIWLVSTVWSMIAIRLYNRRIFKMVMKAE